MKRYIMLAAIAVAAFTGYGIYLAGKNELPPPPAAAPLIFHAGLANGRRISFPSWSATYDKLVTDQDQTLLDVEGVHDGMIYRKGKPYLRVRAHQLTVNTLSHDFSASGPLHVETVANDPHRSFDTTAATWNDAQQTLNLPQRVVIDSGAGSPLYVNSLSFNVKTGDIELHKVAGPIRFK